MKSRRIVRICLWYIKKNAIYFIFIDWRGVRWGICHLDGKIISNLDIRDMGMWFEIIDFFCKPLGYHEWLFDYDFFILLESLIEWERNVCVRVQDPIGCFPASLLSPNSVHRSQELILHSSLNLRFRTSASQATEMYFEPHSRMFMMLFSKSRTKWVFISLIKTWPWKESFLPYSFFNPVEDPPMSKNFHYIRTDL